MPDVHVPKLGEQSHAGKSFVTIALEVLLIGTGVFLGLMGEQWRESRHHRELAESSLRRFRTEIDNNRKAVAAVRDYHVALQERIKKYLAATGKEREAINFEIQGIQPAFTEHTAWDLALATQSLTYIDEQLAFALSRVYFTQQEYADLSRALLQAMYIRPPTENLAVFLGAVSVYYGDAVLIEPKLIGMYDDAEKQIGRELGESPKH